MVLALVPVIAKAGLLIEAARGVIEKRGRSPLGLRVLRIALHDAPARLRDQVEGATKRDTCDAFPSIVSVDEDARDAIVGRLIGAGRLVFLPVMDVRELVRRAVLAPGHRGVAVEDQGRMSVALANETLLPRAALFALGPSLPRMEPGAPAATESHALVLLSETGEGIPRRGVKRLDRVRAHRTSVLSRTSQGAYGLLGELVECLSEPPAQVPMARHSNDVPDAKRVRRALRSGRPLIGRLSTFEDHDDRSTTVEGAGCVAGRLTPLVRCQRPVNWCDEVLDQHHG